MTNKIYIVFYKHKKILSGANSSLTYFLLERDDRKMVYADKVANIFVRNTPENYNLIKKYPDVKLVAEEDKNNGTK